MGGSHRKRGVMIQPFKRCREIGKKAWTQFVDVFTPSRNLVSNSIAIRIVKVVNCLLAFQPIVQEVVSSTTAAATI